jgi:CheY-like chemotaxis protein
MLGGRISVDSEPGKGSRFTFTIQARVAPQPAAASAASLTAGESALHGRRVLIVIDHPATRQSMQRQVEVWGLTAVPAATVHEALSWIREGQRFDVALVDTHLRFSAPMPLIALVTPGVARTDDSLFDAMVTKPVKASRLYDALIEVLPEVAQRVDARSLSTAGGRLADHHPLRVLVAEDNLVNQKVALAMLSHLGYRADLAADGVEAVEAVRRIPYDVVFMDLQMPQLDGVGATRQIIAEHPPGKRPRIIALTANAYEDDRDACLAAGMDDYVSKPLKAETLQDALLRVPGRSPAA